MAQQGSGESRATSRSPARRWLRRALAAVLISVGVAGLVAATDVSDRRARARELVSTQAFLRVPSPLEPGSPGELIRSRRVDAPLIGTSAWRIVYHSRDLRGRDIAVSGTLVVPDLGRRSDIPVLAWAHPTTGAAAACAPSLDTHPFRLVEGLTALLLEGYAVVSTDYPGLGTPGASSYLIGVAESNSVLDSVRAARQLRSELGTDVLLWGHSQGGQAALFAAARASEYAPELRVMGVAVAAPAADLRALLTDDLDTRSGVTITSLTIPAMTAAYDDRFPRPTLESILTPAARAVSSRMAALCLGDKELHRLADPLVGDFVTSPPSTTEPWATILAENSAPTAIRVPVFVGQGLADTLVRPSATLGYVRALCASGSAVESVRYPRITHLLAAYASLPRMLAWQRQLRRGVVPSTCSG